jgi:uncharacterized protein (TIGR00730 family)
VADAPPRPQRICVFCGSSAGDDPAYLQSAIEAGRTLTARGIGVVYGGGRVGLMGALADAVLAAGGEIIGIIPEALAAREIAHRGLTELHVVGSMHERKALMAAESDAFLTLPGGFGTLEELFEAVTWRQLGFHDKPCGIANVAGYFDGLLKFCDDAAAHGFVYARDRAGLFARPSVGETVDELLRRLAIPKVVAE